jgi:hypothetical protein
MRLRAIVLTQVPLSEDEHSCRSSQSAVPYGHSAMAIAVRLVGREYPGAKPPGKNFAVDPVTIAGDVSYSR